jgi:hypothetical protein
MSAVTITVTSHGEALREAKRDANRKVARIVLKGK